MLCLQSLSHYGMIYRNSEVSDTRNRRNRYGVFFNINQYCVKNALYHSIRRVRGSNRQEAERAVGCKEIAGHNIRE